MHFGELNLSGDDLRAEVFNYLSLNHLASEAARNLHRREKGDSISEAKNATH